MKTQAWVREGKTEYEQVGCDLSKRMGTNSSDDSDNNVSSTQSLSLSQFSSVQLLCRVWLFVTPWTVARQASLSITNSRSLLKLMPIEWVMPSNHLILFHLLLLLPSIFPSISLFKWVSSSHQKFSFSVILSYSQLIVNSLFKEQGAKRKGRCCPTIRNFQGDLTFLKFACL